MNSSSDCNENFYDILKCDQSASYEELKQSYQQLIRKYHPDKRDGSVDSEEFLKINRAWKTLRDENSRKQYNNLQMQNEFKSNFLIHAQLSKSELEFKNNENCIDYPCRCGSFFEIYKSYLYEEECVIECNECSNCIIIK